MNNLELASYLGRGRKLGSLPIRLSNNMFLVKSVKKAKSSSWKGP